MLKVIQSFGKYVEGQMIDLERLGYNDYVYICRKLNEGSCLEVINDLREKAKVNIKNKAITNIDNKDNEIRIKGE